MPSGSPDIFSLSLRFHAAPILLGLVLGPRMEENFRNALAISNGHLSVFVTRPISAVFLGCCAVLILVQIYAHVAFSRRRNAGLPGAWPELTPDLASTPELEE